jgi:hypothetical protein
MISSTIQSHFSGRKETRSTGWKSYRLLFIFVLPVIMLLTLTSCSFSLTGDVTPPAGFRPFIPTETAALLATDGGDTSGSVTGTPAPLPTSNVPDTITLNGTILFPAGAAQPSSMQVTLYGFADADSQSTELATTDVLADGSFQFNEVKPLTGQTLYATTTFEGQNYISDVLHSTDIQAGLAYPITITIYSQTQDVSVLSIDRLHIFIQPDTAETFNILELFVVTNLSNQMLVAKETGQPIIWFDLPPNATNVSFDTGMDPFFVVNGNKVGYLPPFDPGSQNQIVFSYSLPYKPSPVFIFGTPSQVLSITAPLAVKSAIVMIPDVGVQVKSSQICSSGSRQMSDTTSILLYTSCGIDQGKSLKLSLSGIAGTNAPADPQPMINLAIGVLVLAAAIVLGVWVYRRYGTGSQAAPQPVETQDAILDAILALDDRFRAGDFARRVPGSYEERRAELLNKLRLLVPGSLESKDPSK